MASIAIGNRAANRSNPCVGLVLLGAYVILYGATLHYMMRFGGFDAGESLALFGVLGVGFSLLAWLLTLGVTPLPYQVREPGRELQALLLYILPLAVFIAYGFQAIHRWIPGEPADSLLFLVAKLSVFVAIPAWLMSSRFGYTMRDLTPLSLPTSHVIAFLGMAGSLLVFQSVAGRGLRDIAAANVPGNTLLFGMPLVFVWLVLEVGVVEEFFFRVLLQSRLSAALRSQLGGVVLASLLFGLVHAPGLYLRTGITQEGLSAHPSLWMAIGYSIVITSVAGFFLGVLWARTRNFLVLVLVHAAADLLPNTLPTLRAFHLLK
jgi:CAAX protease family protein